MTASRYAYSVSVVACLLSSPAHAGEVTHDAPFPHQAVPYEQSLEVPAFDPALGTLRQVRITVSGSVSGSAGIENTSFSPIEGHFNPGAFMWPSAPAGVAGAANPTFEGWRALLDAFDLALDYQGPSGASVTFTDEVGGTPSQESVISSPIHLDGYTGPAGNPGTIEFMISVEADPYELWPSPPIQATYQLSVRGNLRVAYDYDSFPSAFCFGDSSQPCPCASSQNSAGCTNSLGTGGQLSVSGTASLSNDTLVLSGAGMPDAPALYFQGGDFFNYGTAFGDGVLCVAGALRRLGILQNVSGSSQYPDAGDAPVSVQGLVTTTGLRYYQTWYRNAADFCTLARSNLTNAMAIEWGP